MKILIAEDDTKVSRFLARVIAEEGYTPDTCANGSDAVKLARTGLYDLILLDWMLPELDGLAVCRELRRSGLTTPILMLTARGEVRERVLGLETGADDYLVKPFEIEELVARIRALLRRSVALSRVVCGDLEIERVNRRALLRGVPLDLTTREFALLLHLVLRMEQAVPKSELLSHIWELRFDPGSNLVEVHVSRLRDKLGDHAWMIETVRGVGYRLRAQRTP